MTVGGGRQDLTRVWLARRYLVQGRSTEQIAEETGWSSQYVRDRLRGYGIPLRPRGGGGRSGDLLDADRLRGWVGEGLSARQIASRSGYSIAGVYKLLRRHVLLPLPAPPEAALPAPLLDEIAALYRDQRLSMAQIGARYGRGTEWVRRRLVAAGTPLRGPGRGSPAWVSDLPGLVEQGLTTAQIAGRVDRSPATVLDALHAADRRAAPRPRKPLPDPATLRRLYLGQQHTVAEISERLHIPQRRVSQGLAAAGIPRRRAGTRPALPDVSAGQLRTMYEVRQMSVLATAREIGCTWQQVRNALKRHQIPVRRGPHRPPPLRIDSATLRRLYVDERLSDEAIAVRYAVPAHRVRQLRRQLRIHRPPILPPHPPPVAAPPAATLKRLYHRQGLTLEQIGRRYHTSGPAVRRWLDAADIDVTPRTTRAQRRQLDVAAVEQLYRMREWTAAEIAAELDSTTNLVLRTLHDNGIPVRRGGSCRRGPLDQQDPRLAALYRDPDVQALLRRHAIPARPAPGPIAARFPTPVPLTGQLLRDAYQGTGLAASQIELLTGQPAGQILDALRAAGIPVRRGRGRSPWLVRQRQQQAR